jgi:hypothetical protein
LDVLARAPHPQVAGARERAEDKPLPDRDRRGRARLDLAERPAVAVRERKEARLPGSSCIGADGQREAE